MQLPEEFTFTQQNLQDYLDCPCRFLLRHVQKLEWPAIESEPVREQEERIQAGMRFHLLCQQYLCGVPKELLINPQMNAEFQEWWQSFLLLDLPKQNTEMVIEKLFSIPFCGYRLAAKYDLILLTDENELTIYDWKTSQHQPKRQTLLERMQTKVYPLVGAQVYANRGISPESIRMVYWYPAFPNSPVELVYSSTQMSEDRSLLDKTIGEILSKSEGDFHKTSREKHCLTCTYRSLCERGISAGKIDEEEEMDHFENAFNLDFEAL